MNRLLKSEVLYLDGIEESSNDLDLSLDFVDLVEQKDDFKSTDGDDKKFTGEGLT